MLGSVLLYAIDSGILFILLFSLLLNSSFRLILSTFLIYSSRISALYCWSRNSCLMIAQILSNFVVVEQIVFSPKAYLYEMLQNEQNKESITFKIKTGYYLKDSTPEVIKLLGSNKISA